jgi:hypothetical protein
LKAADFRVFAEIADQRYFVEAVGHMKSPLVLCLLDTV